MTALPGIDGSLFPTAYLASALEDELSGWLASSHIDGRRRRFQAWWRHVEHSCGPATGLRALFDVVAMPLAGLLGFRARDASFGRTRVTARLATGRGTPVGLVLLPWASRPSEVWRVVFDTARSIEASWCLVVAPPFVSVVDANRRSIRRSVDFALPAALGDRSFVCFWTLLHARAFDPGAIADPARTIASPSRLAAIDVLAARAAEFQERVRDDLQQGVVQALDALGPEAPFAEALTVVYRILFLLFAESRDLVPRHHPVYGPAYSIAALCREALANGGRAAGLWQGLAAVTRLSRVGCRVDDLIVRPFNGRLFARSAAPSLEDRRGRSRARRAARGRDRALSQALVSLGTRPDKAGRVAIAYADLGVEQLGAVYERVLDLEPAGAPPAPARTVIRGRPSAPGRPSPASPRQPGSRHSRRRKETGTFYTPQSLAEFVVRRTLAPLVQGATSDGILALRVVDPAMGSGAFLVAACRYLADAYECALVDEGRLAESDLDTERRADLRRQVAERCLAGVDLNPVAAELARLSVWLTTLARGKPLGFLDHRLRVGNSLVGASPDDLWRRPSRAGASGGRALPLFDAASLEGAIREVVRPLQELTARRDDSIDDVHMKERLWRAIVDARSPLEPWRAACHLWCARFFHAARGPGVPPGDRAPSDAELGAAIDALVKGDRTLPDDVLKRWMAAARSIARDRSFFHWPLEFADIFYDGLGQPRASPGFDAVFGNPPWEMLRHEPDASHEPAGDVASFVRYVRESGLFPSCDRGHVNLYQPFLDRSLSLAKPGGRVGLILPWGVASDAGARELRRRLFNHARVDCIVGLENGGGLFPIHRGLRFVTVIADAGRGADPEREIRAVFGVRTREAIDRLPDVDDAGARSAFPLRLTPARLARIGGRDLRIPDLRRTNDLGWIERITRAHPPLGSAGGWSAHFGRELNVTDDRAAFGPAGLPVIEGKAISPFVVDVTRAAHWIAAGDARRLLADRRFERARLAYRDVSGAGNRFTLIAAVVPPGVVTTHTLFCLRESLEPLQQAYLCGLFNSYVLNGFVRIFMGGHVTTGLVEDLPVPVWTGAAVERRIARLSMRLARRRASTAAHAGLQAAVARRYGCDREEFAQILDSCPLVPIEDRRRALAIFESFRRR